MGSGPSRQLAGGPEVLHPHGLRCLSAIAQARPRRSLDILPC